MNSHRLRRLAALAVLALLTVGCGTISNFQKGKTRDDSPPAKVFGGVREDWECLTENTDGPCGGPLIPVCVVALVAVDMPLSLIGDVVTLPWTIRAARLRKAQAAGPR